MLRGVSAGALLNVRAAMVMCAWFSTRRSGDSEGSPQAAPTSSGAAGDQGSNSLPHMGDA